MAWTLDRTHQLSRPSRDGLAALVREVAPRSTVARVRRLGGGLSTATHIVELRSQAGNATAVILKRYRADDTASPKEEWSRLRFAQRVDVPTPEPIALDRAGDWFGTPALVMRRLPGRSYVVPTDLDGYLGQLAEAQLAIQDTSLARAPAAVRRPRVAAELKPREELRRTPTVDRAIRAIRAERAAALRADVRFGHGDLHPGNIVWSRRRLVGIADWRHSGLAPRAWEVAYTRVDLAVLLGPAVADRFLGHYQDRFAGELEHLRVWDLEQGLAAMRWCHYWALAYREQGRRDLTDAKAKRRARTFVRRVLDRS